MKKLFLPLLLASFAAACASDPLQLENEPIPSEASAQVRPTLGETFQLRAGEVASVSGGILLVAFHSVEGDSRCPTDVTCVWAGDAELLIGTASEGGRWSWAVLHTGIEPRSRKASGFTITLVGVEPEKTSGTSIPQASYAVLLRITQE